MDQFQILPPLNEEIQGQVLCYVDYFDQVFTIFALLHKQSREFLENEENFINFKKLCKLRKFGVKDRGVLVGLTDKELAFFELGLHIFSENIPDKEIEDVIKRDLFDINSLKVKYETPTSYRRFESAVFQQLTLETMGYEIDWL